MGVWKLEKHKRKTLFSFILTNAERILLELRGEVGDVGQTEEVSLYDVPAHLIVKWVPELCWHLNNDDRNMYIFLNNLIHLIITFLYFHKIYLGIYDVTEDKIFSKGAFTPVLFGLF